MSPRTVVTLVAIHSLGGCGSEQQPPRQSIEREGHPPVTFVAPDSPDMTAAIERARSSTDRFIAALADPKRAQSSFSVKVSVQDGEHIEHVWVSKVLYRNGKFLGKIGNAPARVSGVAIGDEVSLPMREVSDWMYVDNGRLVGGYTLRVLRDGMSDEERHKFDRSVPFVVTDDVVASDPLVQLLDSIGNAEYETLLSILTRQPDYANRSSKVAVENLWGDMELETQDPLRYAVHHGDAKAVEILLRHGANPNARDDYLATPLHEAAMRGHSEIIRLLMKHGADVDARNTIGVTPLKTAAGNNNVACTKVLLELGADVHSRLDGNEQTVLFNFRSVSVAQLLLAGGADIDAVDKDGQTPLHNAVLNGNADLAAYLAGQGGDTQARNAKGLTPVDLAKNHLEGDDLAKFLSAAKK